MSLISFDTAFTNRINWLCHQLDTDQLINKAEALEELHDLVNKRQKLREIMNGDLKDTSEATD